MTILGLISIFTATPYPEFATAGISAVLASGLVGTIGKEETKSDRRTVRARSRKA